MLDSSHPRSSRGVSGDDPEGGAGSGVLRPAARDRWPREAREVARQALRPGCEELAARIRKATARRCRTAGAQGDGSAAPRPKIAAVERREASVPRHGTQGASQAPGTPRYGVPHGCPAEHPNVSRRSASVSAKLVNSPNNSCRCAAIPGFFPVCKTGVVTPA